MTQITLTEEDFLALADIADAQARIDQDDRLATEATARRDDITVALRDAGATPERLAKALQISEHTVNNRLKKLRKPRNPRTWTVDQRNDSIVHAYSEMNLTSRQISDLFKISQDQVIEVLTGRGISLRPKD